MHSTGSQVQFPQHSRYPKGRSGQDAAEMKCDMCNITVMGRDQYNSHLSGAKHAKKVKEIENNKKIEEIPYLSFDEYTMGYTCTVCKVSLNSSSVAIYHIAGSRHMEAVKAINPGEAAAPEPNGKETPMETEKEPPSETPTPDNTAVKEFGGNKVAQNAPPPPRNPPPNRNFNRMAPPWSNGFNWRGNGPPWRGSPPNWNGFPPRPNMHPMMKYRHFKPLASSFVSKYTLHDVEASVVTGMNARPRPPNPAKGHQTFPCLACNIVTNSEHQLQAHLSSERHKNRLGPNNRWYNGRQPGPPQPTSALRCESCNISVNSQIQLDQHLQSPKHRNKLALRYRPYPNNKPQAAE